VKHIVVKELCTEQEYGGAPNELVGLRVLGVDASAVPVREPECPCRYTAHVICTGWSAVERMVHMPAA
jgi:hypothetical protein